MWLILNHIVVLQDRQGTYYDKTLQRMPRYTDWI